jgi:hypothetical protein
MSDRRQVYTLATVLTAAMLAAGVGGVAMAQHGPSGGAQPVRVVQAAPAPTFQFADDAGETS